MKKLFTFFAIALCVGVYAQKTDTLTIHYYENFPYAYNEAGKLVGIEVDIVNEYVSWLKQKKNITAVVSYKPYKDFSEFYQSVKDGKKSVLGLGSVTRNTERENEVEFTAPYLRNMAVLVTVGNVPTIRTKSEEEIKKVFGNMKAEAVKGSSHVNYLNNIKTYLPALQVTTVETQKRVIEDIISAGNIFGYVDILAYWSFLKASPSKYLKIQKVFNEPKEEFGFILPKTNSQGQLLNEFFEGGFGFTSTKVYHQILEKYLGYEVIDAVEVK